jgi:glycerophosphoryl diester phosphodiesterase
LSRDQSSWKSPLIIAHRGASSSAPENTLAAFGRAFEDGADGIELDVWLARDGVPVVIHDPTLRRTGRREGHVSQMSSKELSRVDVGSWFNQAHPKQSVSDYAHERVPTLDEVFQLTKDLSKPGRQPLLIYTELKTDLTTDPRKLVQAVINLIEKNRLGGQVVVISFDLNAVALVKQTNAAVRTGALFAPRTKASSVLGSRRRVALAAEYGANEILLHRLLTTPRAVETALQSNLTPVVWTADHPAWVHRAKAWGIRALITNNPAELKTATL